eukprot:COSAG05_NODE_639_length_8156_cov_122.162840_8_plen_98_part_00
MNSVAERCEAQAQHEEVRSFLFSTRTTEIYLQNGCAHGAWPEWKAGEQALGWWLRAAEQGHVQALYQAAASTLSGARALDSHRRSNPQPCIMRALIL